MGIYLVIHYVSFFFPFSLSYLFDENFDESRSCHDEMSKCLHEIEPHLLYPKAHSAGFSQNPRHQRQQLLGQILDKRTIPHVSVTQKKKKEKGK